MRCVPPGTGVILGSVFGVVLALCVAVAAVFVFRRWRQPDNDDMVEMVTNGDDDLASTT